MLTTGLPSSGRPSSLRRWWQALRPSWRRRKLPTISAEEAYSMWAADYGRPPNRFQVLEQASLLKLLPELTRRVVLDLGCGSGRIGSLVLERGAARAFGIDSVLPMLERASAAPAPKAVCAAGRVPELPFGDGVFDVVTSALMMGHLRDLGAALCEVARVLRPNGLLVISDFHPSASLRGWRRTVTDPGTGREYAIEHHVHPLADYHRELARLDIVVEAVDEPQHKGFPVAFVLRARKTRTDDGPDR